MTKEQLHYLQWIASLWEFPGKTKRLLLKRFQDPEELFRLSEDKWRELLAPKQVEIAVRRQKEALTEIGKLRKERAEGVVQNGCEAYLREEYEKLGRLGISFVTMEQEEYPKRLLEIPDPPLGIYYKGKLPDDEISVSIIGSRDCSEYGSYVASALGKYLGERGIPVISGMARGIDGISQQAALEAGGLSYGVLGCGVDVCYPKSNERLYQKLTERGGILSEYPPGTPPAPFNFPPRNRIVSGLSQAVVVVEAAVKSGTSITVSMALDQGRDVYVVPGRVTDRLSDGCNRLIKQGASVFTDPKSFLEELQETYFIQCVSPAGGRASRVKALNAKAPELPKELQGLWALLDHTPKSVEELQKNLAEPLSIQDCTIRLMELMLSGMAKQVSPGQFCKV